MCFSFHVDVLFHQLSSFKPDTKIIQILTLYQASAPTWRGAIFFKICT